MKLLILLFLGKFLLFEVSKYITKYKLDQKTSCILHNVKYINILHVNMDLEFFYCY